MLVERLSKYFGETLVVDGFNLQFRESELIALLGPSGCGKTTTLRMIAGFEQPSSGSIHVNGKDITTLPPEKRNAGMVFQSYALFPHMTVSENISFGLQMRRVEKAEAARRVRQVVERVGLTGLQDRYPRQLSGGQQQRTALARALVIGPDVLLLDEPLANLDANLREEMRLYIREIQREFGITTIYVTHDQAEALALADRIGVMIAGRLQQIEVPDLVYRRPANVLVARFLGVTNLIEARVVERSGNRALVETAIGRLACSTGGAIRIGEGGFLGVRPGDIGIAADETGGPNQVRGTLVSKIFLGSYSDCLVRLSETLTLRVYAPAAFPVTAGDAVTLTFSEDESWLMEGGDGVR